MTRRLIPLRAEVARPEALGGVEVDGAPPYLDVRLALPAAGAWLGAWSGLALPPPASAACCALIAAMGVFWWRTRQAGVASCLCLVAGIAVAALRVVALNLGPLDELAAEGATGSVHLVITADPRAHHMVATGPALGSPFFVVRARAETITARGRTAQIRSPVLVLASDPTWADLLPTQRVGVSGRLSTARPGQAVAAVLHVNGRPQLVGHPSAVQRAAGELRLGLREAVAHLSPGPRGLVPGLVLGDTAGMAPRLTEDFRTAGLTHLTAVSGANLAIVCGFVLYVGRWAGVRRRWLPALGLLALVGFVVLARPQPSVLRAGAMALVGLAALGSGRRAGGLAALAAAVLSLVLIDPWLARSYGFALSVLATLGLLLFAGRWASALHARGLPRPLAYAMAVPAAAQITCSPLVTMLSAQVSLVAIPANLLVAPAIAPATVLGVLATLVAAFNDRLATALGWAAGLPTWWVVFVAQYAASLPMAAVPWPASRLGALCLAAVLFVVVALAPRLGRHRRVLAFFLVAALASTGVVATRPGWPPPGWLLIACDVGQGDALVLSAGRAGAVVVDAGPDPRLIDRCLRDLGIERVAAVLVTHLHADHVEGLPGLLRDREVGEVHLGGVYDEPSAELRRVRAWTRQAGIPIRRVQVGERYQLGALTWQVLWPARVIDGDGSTPNNASVVLLAEYGGTRMLLTGDVEPAAQRAMVARWQLESVDVLKVAHHGSAAQAPELLDAVRPRLAMISVGTGNDYGHPAPSTLRDLARVGALVARTDRDGAIAVVGPVERLRLVVGGR